MGDEIRPEVIKRTQDTLGKYIKKPPLTEKLLKKPPFRFLHDIVTAVIRETGFLQDLFSVEELNHENIKDREGKVAFLQKIIDAIKAITGTNLTVRPTKIVAGHEPSKTNELLQAIGKALDKKLSSVDYVETLQKKGKKPKSTIKTNPKENAPKTKSTAPSKPTSQVRTQSQDRARAKEQEKKKTSKLTSDANTKISKLKKETPAEKTSKTNEPVEEAPQPVQEAVVQDQPTIEGVPGDNTAEEAAVVLSPRVKEPEAKRPHSARLGHRKPSASTVNRLPPDLNALENMGGDASQNNNAETQVLDAKEETRVLAPPQPVEIQLLGAETSKSEPVKELASAPVPRSARPQTGIRPQTALRPPSARPPSARPAAPRIRDRGEIRITDESSSPMGKVNVITENESIVEQEEDDNFIVVESQASVLTEEQRQSPVPAATDLKPVEGGQHGHLVAQILETQKELEDDGQPKKVEIEWEAGRHRERELAGREIDRLRSSIQTLTRAANPLGKLMDFLQEDVDSMQRELDTWRRTNTELMAQLRTENSQTQELTEPLNLHLQQLELSIKEQLDQLSALKATVLRNDQRIHRLLTGDDGSAVK